MLSIKRFYVSENNRAWSVKQDDSRIPLKELLPKNQAGFRRGMGTMDQYYALNYLINRLSR